MYKTRKKMNERTKNMLLLFLLASCWGPSFLFIKIAVEEIQPLMLAALRIGIGALVLNLFLMVKGERLPTTFSFWKRIVVAGFFAQGLPFVLINWGEQYVDSSLASLMNGMVPLFTIVFAQFMLQDERMTVNKTIGVVIGFLGLVFLVYPNLREGITASTYGIIAIALASVSYGIGLVYIRKYLTKVSSVQAPAAQLLSVTVYLVPIAFWMYPSFDVMAISSASVWSVSILGVFGTAIAFILYFKLIERTSAGYASMVTYLMPIYGVLLGAAFLEEAITGWMILGAGLILGGISFVNRKKKETPPSFDEHLDVAYFSKVR